MKDYYKTLQIHPEASLDVMNTAYRTLVRQCHPDLYHVSSKHLMNEKMREINEAYEVLSNSARRAEYDRSYQRQANSGLVSPDKQPVALHKLFSATNLKKILFWALATWVISSFLLKPLMMTPLFRPLLLGFAIYLFIRFYRKRKT